VSAVQSAAMLVELAVPSEVPLAITGESLLFNVVPHPYRPARHPMAYSSPFR